MHAPVRCEFALSPSHWLLTLVAIGHALVLGLLWLLLPAWQGTALCLVVLLLGLLHWLQHYRTGGSATVAGIRYDEHGWALRFDGNHGIAANDSRRQPVTWSWCGARLLAPVFCHRHLLVLRFRCHGRWLPVTVAVTHDSCSIDDFRRLRVLARHLPAPRLWAASR